MSETTRKTWDGHAVALSFEGSGFIRGEWVCPHDGKTFEGDATPTCRRSYGPDSEADSSQPYGRCIAGDDARLDLFDDVYFEITQVPVPVRFWWDVFGEEFSCEPVRVDADGTYEVPRAAEVPA